MMAHAAVLKVSGTERPAQTAPETQAETAKAKLQPLLKRAKAETVRSI
jgi:hypothetical protein